MTTSTVCRVRVESLLSYGCSSMEICALDNACTAARQVERLWYVVVPPLRSLLVKFLRLTYLHCSHSPS